MAAQQRPRRVIIDTDPGIDDAMAIFMALRSLEDAEFRAAHPSYVPLEVLGITTVFGNAPVRTCTENALRLLERMGRLDIPVVEGEAQPLGSGPAPTFAAFVHGDDGLGNTHQPPPARTVAPSRQRAPEWLVEQVALAPGEVTILAIGPLTNLARAVDLDPQFASNVREIIVMGGAYTVSGNVNPAAEANFFNDAIAADRVCTCGCRLKLVGLDVTQQATLSGATMRGVVGRSGTGGAWVASISRYYFRFNQHTIGHDGCYLHDPMTVLVAMDPTICQWREAAVRVVSGSGSSFARGHSLMVKQSYSGAAREEPCFHEGEPGQPSEFAHRPAEVALGLDRERAVATTVALLSFDFPTATRRPSAHDDAPASLSRL